MGMTKCYSTAEHRSRIFNFAALALGDAVVMAPISASAVPAKILPPEVRAYFDTARQECRAAGDLLPVTDEAGFAEHADFTGDDHPDSVIHMASLYCPSLGASQYCVSARCAITIPPSH